MHQIDGEAGLWLHAERHPCKRLVPARAVTPSKEWDMVPKGNSRLNRIPCCMRAPTPNQKLFSKVKLFSTTSESGLHGWGLYHSQGVNLRQLTETVCKYEVDSCGTSKNPLNQAQHPTGNEGHVKPNSRPCSETYSFGRQRVKETLGIIFTSLLISRQSPLVGWNHIPQIMSTDFF